MHARYTAGSTSAPRRHQPGDYAFNALQYHKSNRLSNRGASAVTRVFDALKQLLPQASSKGQQQRQQADRQQSGPQWLQREEDSSLSTADATALSKTPLWDEVEEEWGEDEDEGSTMRPLDMEGGLDGSDSGVFGPLAVLLVGFMRDEVDAFRSELLAIGAGEVLVIPATRAMLTGPLQAALEVEAPPAYEQPPLGVRRAVVMSGMMGSEIIEVVSCYKGSGLAPAVFAAAVPRNYHRQVLELLTEVAAEHAMMQEQHRRAAALQPPAAES